MTDLPDYNEFQSNSAGAGFREDNRVDSVIAGDKF